MTAPQDVAGFDRSGDLGHRRLVGFLVPWDLSKAPSVHNREMHLGHWMGTTAYVMANLDKNSLKAQVANGLHGRDWNSRMILDPSNWVPRLKDKGNSAENVLAIRLISDTTNKDWFNEHMSTIVVDEEEQRGWAWFRDLGRLVDLDTPVAADELEFNDAGFLPHLYPKGDKITNGKARRAALALNISRNAGAVTDGSGNIGSFAQILRWSGGSSVSAALGRPRNKATLAMNAEGPFAYDDQKNVALPKMQKAGDVRECEDGDDQVQVIFYEGAPGGDKMTLSSDDKSNHPDWDRPAYSRIEAFACLPKKTTDP